MLLTGENSVPIENPDGADEENFRALALAEFPNLAEDFAEYEDLLHLQMAAFSRVAEEAVELGDFATVERCYRLLEETLKTAKFNLRNAIYVSFLEHINFETPNGTKARQLLPRILSEMLVELEEHLQMLYEHQLKRQDAE